MRELEGGAAGGAAEVERAACRAVAHRGDGDLRQCAREVGHAEALVAEVEFGVFRQLPVGLVIDIGRHSRRIGDHVAQPRVLEEVAAESIARGADALVATGGPGAALHEVVAAVEGGRGEVVVDVVDAEALERVDRRLGPLPDVADHVVEGTLRVTIDRAARGTVVEMQVGGGRAVVRHLGDAGDVVEAVPLVLGGQTVVAPGDGRHPAAEGLGFEAIDLDRPVPRHRHHLGHQAQLPGVAIADPEGRRLGQRIAPPALALLIPPLRVAVAASLDEGKVLGVADQHAAGLKGRKVDFALAILVVPTVDRVVKRLSETHHAGGHRHQRVDRRIERRGSVFESAAVGRPR